MKKVIALSWDKLFLSSSQFESKLASIFHRTDILSSSFSTDKALGKNSANWSKYMEQIAISDKFNFEEVIERFDYLENLLANGHSLIVITNLQGAGAEAVRALLKEQGFSIPVITTAGNLSRVKLEIRYDIYINYDWFQMMPVIVTRPDFYLVKSAMLIRSCLFKVKKILPLGNFSKN